MLERLQTVDWNALTHAYGAAADVPDLLRALADPDRQVRKDAYWELYGNIFHQGTRYPATAPAIPFLLELLADPATPDRHELLLLVTHLVTGQFSVAADPVMYAGESDGARDRSDTLDYSDILRDVYRAAEVGLPLYLDLVQHAETAAVRGAAAFLLACLWTHAATVVPVLRRRLARETSAPGRASLVFALGRLQDAHGPDPELVRLHRDDPAPVVRLLAAVGLTRGAGPELAPAVVDTLIAAVEDPDSVPGYDDLPCGERDLAGDIGYVLRSLPPALGKRALPALCAALGRAEDFGTAGLVEAMLAFAFGEPRPVPEDSDEDVQAPRIDPAALTDDQRRVLAVMAGTHELWTIGNLFFVLRSHGVPTRREELAALLGVPLVRDEAAELAAQARFHRVHMHNPAEAVTLLQKAVALVPGDARLWHQLAQSHHAVGDLPDALAAADRALALDPGHAAAHFERGLVAAHSAPAEAAASFARAAALGHQPLQARTNQSTCLAMIGQRDAAIDLLTALTDEHPEFAPGWYSRGLALVKLGRHLESIVALDRAVALDPDHANAHYARACAHALLGRRGPALADIARACAIDPAVRQAIRDDADFVELIDDPEFVRLTTPSDEPPPAAPVGVLRN
ncbi:MAG: tetratricopeptide repeat protein [Myxococcales bacterium]|nr:tetratricopeptide repeat protein [Myxococcales bacterium]